MNNQIQNFLQSHKICSVCSRPLSLYLKVEDSTLFKAEEINPYCYKFRQYLNKNPTIGADEKIIIFYDGEWSSHFSSNNLLSFVKDKKIFLYLLCNEDGFQCHSYDSRFDMNYYYICSQKNTPFLNFHKITENRYKLVPSSDKVFGIENFCFKKFDEERNHTYVLNLNYLKSEMKFNYYSFTNEEEDDSFFRPTILEKELPIPSLDFSFERRNELFSQFDSWVLMS